METGKNWNWISLTREGSTNRYLFCYTFTAQKIKFIITDFFGKCDQIRRKLLIWSYWLKKSVMENLIFCAVLHCNFIAVTAQKIKFSIKDFHKNFLRIWSHSLKKSLLENFIFCTVIRNPIGPSNWLSE